MKNFSDPTKRRKWPDNWIIVTNIDYSAVPKTGAFDTIKALIKKSNPKLADRFAIWGGQKVSHLLASNVDVASRYGAFITPGNVLAALQEELADSKASTRDIVRYLVVSQFVDQQFTKLEQAGSSSDNRPGIQRLFRDIPFASNEFLGERMAARTLVRCLAQNHTVDAQSETSIWNEWQRNPLRSRIWFIKGGPGQGKSTITQYFCQIQRAALILSDNTTRVSSKIKPVILEVRDVAQKSDLWPKLPRIPVVFELKEYAKWIDNNNFSANSILMYLAARIEETSAQKTLAGTLKRAFSTSRWLFVFDGMDEVPGDMKDVVAKEINYFVDDLLIDCGADAQIICTSRPQGYSGQFDSLDSAEIRLTSLSPEQALECARPILEADRPPREGVRLLRILSDAISSQAIREIMTTPLQAHIMAVVVRDGGRPPERKWDLFSKFYKVINKREADKSADKKLSALLRGHGKLIKALHNRLGFELHSRAEAGAGAQASLDRSYLLKIIEETVREYQSEDAEETINTLREATTDRLVLVNTPDNSESVRFDIRPLQEFFAAEYIYESASYATLPDRVRVISSDSHWREVLHFLLSALIENERRGELAQVIQVLSEVDDPVEKDTRPLARRLAIGAQAVSRLLQEGVLEEDQRTRQSFKSCLIPILSTTDLWTGLLSIDREHSRRWVVDVIQENLSDQVEPENVGAAAAAFFLIDRGAKQAESTKEILLRSSMPYRACVFRIVSRDLDRNSQSPAVTRWGAEIVFRSLLDPDWHLMGRMGLNGAYRILDRENAEEAARDVGLTEEAARIIGAMLSGYGFPERSLGADRELNYGIVSVSMQKPPPELDAATWSHDVVDELRLAGGLFSLGIDVILASKKGNDGSSWFVSQHKDELNQLCCLPFRLQAFLTPESIRTDLTTQLCENDIIKTEFGGETETFMLTPHDKGKWNIKELANDYPDMALNFVTVGRPGFPSARTDELFKSTSNVRHIIDILRSSKRRTLEVASKWGFFIKNMPKHEDELRRIFADSARTGMAIEPMYSETLMPMRIMLPEEAVILPYVLIPFIRKALEQQNRRQYLSKKTEEKYGYISGLIASIKHFDVDRGELEAILTNPDLPQQVQAASRIVHLLLFRELKTLAVQDAEVLSGHYSDAIAHWFLPAVGLVVNDAVEVDRFDVRVLFSQLLLASRSDYPTRLKVDPLLEKWREFTRTPVLKSERNIWLPDK